MGIQLLPMQWANVAGEEARQVLNKINFSRKGHSRTRMLLCEMYFMYISMPAWLIVHNLCHAPSATNSKNFTISNRDASFDFLQGSSLRDDVWRKNWCRMTSRSHWCFFSCTCWSHSGRWRILRQQQKQLHNEGREFSICCKNSQLTSILWSSFLQVNPVNKGNEALYMAWIKKRSKL